MSSVVLTQPVIPISTTYTLTSFAAKQYRNANKLSDLTFYIPGFYRNTQHTNYSTVRIVRAIIPLSSYVVDEPYDKLEISGELNSLPQGDYTPEEFGQLIASYLPNGTSTIANYVYTFTSTAPFIIGKNTTCTTQLGMDVKTPIYSKTIVDPDGSEIEYATMPNQFSFDIPDSFYIYIDELNNSLNVKTNQKYFWQILNTHPQDSQLNYENNTNSVVTIPPNSSIDYLNIQIKDVNGNFIDFHGVEWTLVFEVSEYLNYPDTTPSTNLTGDPLFSSMPSNRKRRYY
jgi:hypothetical protein